mmetsp:Transcript_19589/g.24001  ORF Transcript_19589/g.24001 Transcript_19589/m.24001 type:complete len:255 (-) Transcript_19589:126-890(-)
MISVEQNTGTVIGSSRTEREVKRRGQNQYHNFRTLENVLFFTLIYMTIVLSFPAVASACGVCAARSCIPSHHSQSQYLTNTIRRSAFFPLAVAATRKQTFSCSKPTLVNVATSYAVSKCAQRLSKHFWKVDASSEERSNVTNENAEKSKTTEQDQSIDDDDTSKQQENDKTNDPMSFSMVASIGFYKKIISPLLPPACRFLPTCSQYGVGAIEEFGPGKGAILTTWRLLRCSPVGGRGYDPPKWPPVVYNYGSY